MVARVPVGGVARGVRSDQSWREPPIPPPGMALRLPVLLRLPLATPLVPIKMHVCNGGERQGWSHFSRPRLSSSWGVGEACRRGGEPDFCRPEENARGKSSFGQPKRSRPPGSDRWRGSAPRAVEPSVRFPLRPLPSPGEDGLTAGHWLRLQDSQEGPKSAPSPRSPP